MCVKAVNTYSFVFDSFLDLYKSQEICDEAIDGNADALKIVPDRYKTQEMCDKVINDYGNT